MAGTEGTLKELDESVDGGRPLLVREALSKLKNKPPLSIHDLEATLSSGDDFVDFRIIEAILGQPELIDADCAQIDSLVVRFLSRVIQSGGNNSSSTVQHDSVKLLTHLFLERWHECLGQKHARPACRTVELIQSELERLCLTRTPETTELILIVALEEMFQTQGVCERFTHWKRNPCLRPIYEEALLLSGTNDCAPRFARARKNRH